MRRSRLREAAARPTPTSGSNAFALRPSLRATVSCRRRWKARRSDSAFASCVNGAWGFSAGFDLSADVVAGVARRACDVAESLAPLNTEPVTLADEPIYTDTYVSSYEVDPFSVPEDEKIQFLLSLNDRALASKLVDRVTSVRTFSSASRSIWRRWPDRASRSSGFG